MDVTERDFAIRCLASAAGELQQQVKAFKEENATLRTENKNLRRLMANAEQMKRSTTTKLGISLAQVEPI
jgi:regulator of replication initiation timing